MRSALRRSPVQVRLRPEGTHAIVSASIAAIHGGEADPDHTACCGGSRTNAHSAATIAAATVTGLDGRMRMLAR